MARIAEPIIIHKRGNSFQVTLNSTCGLPQRVCAEWQRRSFRTLPEELSNYRNPNSKPEAKANAQVLIAFLRKRLEAGAAVRRAAAEDITVGDWLRKFIRIETSPRTGFNASRNRPYSPDTVETYRGYYNTHIREDPFTLLKMAEVEEEDAMEYITRLSVKKGKTGRPMGGTRTFAGVIIFIRMAFREYQKKNRKWFNPFQYINPPVVNSKPRDALPEDEMLRLFEPGVLTTTMDLAVCAAMFLSGLRRSEIFALKPECLDWHTPKITVRTPGRLLIEKPEYWGLQKGKGNERLPLILFSRKLLRNFGKKTGSMNLFSVIKTALLPGHPGLKAGSRNGLPAPVLSWADGTLSLTVPATHWHLC